MTKKWTMESARNYVRKVQNGKQQVGLTYCSALDFLIKNGSAEKIKVKANDDISESSS